MTLLTALRTAAMSALAGAHLARKSSRTMALIGNGAQSEFQALAFKAMLGIEEVRLYDCDPEATQKCMRNLEGLGLRITLCKSVDSAGEGADIITTATADKRLATILSDNHVGAGVHINAIGGDCPGKTELHKDILMRASIFVEYEPQTRVEGEIQQLAPDHPVTCLSEVISGDAAGRRSDTQITLFDSVGFGVEDFSALRYIRDLSERTRQFQYLDMLAAPSDTRDLFGMI